MKIMKVRASIKIKCDVKDCKNDAEYFFGCKGYAKSFYLCANCLKKLAEETAFLKESKKVINGKKGGKSDSEKL